MLKCSLSLYYSQRYVKKMEFKLSYCPTALPLLPKSSFRCEMAFCAFPLYSSSRVTKRLPIMAPDAWEQGVSNVCRLLMPKPTMRGLRRFISVSYTHLDGEPRHFCRFVGQVPHGRPNCIWLPPALYSDCRS